MRTLALLCLFLLSCAAPYSLSNDTLRIQTAEQEIPLTIEIAQTSDERHQGLSHRTHLKENHGMLFIFEEEKMLTFWMKDTLIPLDIFFIGKDSKVVDIQTMQSCLEEPCPFYISKEKAQYALEVNAGFALQHKIIIGDTVKWA
ncbi:MAG TPA: DUF192 domain-containing protein [Candidatus Nanoarchaeia archaeon]|nr:DUF192 domain-containing protein [Candidatus Nanoarchaeia archaeon]